MSGAIIFFRNPIFEEVGKILDKIAKYPLKKQVLASAILMVSQFLIMIIGCKMVDYSMLCAEAMINYFGG